MARVAEACHDALVRKADITVDLVSRLVRTQFPKWAHLSVRPVDVDGWDNATFRLGKTMSIRLPSARQYVEAVEKEQRWLPILASQLPLPIPQPLAMGAPGCGFRWPWSVYRWIDGTPLTMDAITDLPQFAAEVWQAALDASWHGSDVWFHGDAQPGNLLLNNGRLSAVLDFGTSGVGDPACDTTIAWTFLSGESSRVFKERLPVDSATWVRGRGWAIWKAMKVLVAALESDPHDAAITMDVIHKILADHLAET